MKPLLKNSLENKKIDMAVKDAVLTQCWWNLLALLGFGLGLKNLQ